MRKIIHLLKGTRMACGLPAFCNDQITLKNMRHTSDVGKVTCHNCEDALKSRNRAAYWDYERAAADLKAAEPELTSCLQGILARFPYMRGEIRHQIDHIAQTVSFWIPEDGYKDDSVHTLNISHTATPCYIPVRAFNEGERVMIADRLAEIVERLHLRSRITRRTPELAFTIKPYFYKRGSDGRG